MRHHGFSCFLILSVLVSISLAQNRFNIPGNLTFAVLLPVHLSKSLETCVDVLYGRGLGLGYVETIAYAVQEINKDSDILPNVTLGMEVWDYCSSEKLAVRAAHSIVSNNKLHSLVTENGIDESKIGNLTQPILAVIGTMGSQSTSYIASLLQVENVPVISAFATSDQLSLPFFDTFFRTVPPDSMQAKAMVSVIEHFNWTYVAIAARDNAYGQYGARALQREAYNRKTFCIAVTEYFTDYGLQGEYSSIVKKIKLMNNVQVIVFWGDHENAKELFLEAGKQELFGRTFLMSEAMFTVDPDVLGRRHESVLKGAIGVVPHRNQDDELETYLRNLTPQKTRSGLPWWEEFWRAEFNCTSSKSAAHSISSCNESMELSEVGVTSMTNEYTPYLTDAVYTVARALHAMKSCSEQNGAAKTGCKPKHLVREMRNVSFPGKSGMIEFTDRGNPTNARYDFVNFQIKNGEYRFVTIGEWHGRRRNQSYYKINDALIGWNTKDNKVPMSVCMTACAPGYNTVPTTACCWTCLRCPSGTINPSGKDPNCTKCPAEQMSNDNHTKCVPRPAGNINWGDATAIVFVSLAVVGIFITLIVTVVFLRNKHTPLVKGANLELSILLLSIIILIFTLTLLHIAEPTDAICNIIQPWRYITCTLCVSVLFLKTNRIVQAFQTVLTVWFKRFILGRRRQLATVFIINSIQIILAALWLYLDPPYHKRQINTHIFITCVPFKTPIGTALRAIMFTYLIFMSIMCALYAFKARKLPESFNEARYIGFSLYILLLSWIAYYPVDSALEGSYITIVACATALVIAYGVLGCMFFPKVFVIWKHPEQNTNEVVKAAVERFTFRSGSATNALN